MFQSLFSGGSSKRSRRRKAQAGSMCEVQKLEDRKLLTRGDVVMALRGSTVRFTGDNDNATMEVTTVGNEIEVTPTFGTTLNGRTNTVTIPAGFTKLDFRMKGGTDQIRIEDFDAEIDLVFNMGSGIDFVTIEDSQIDGDVTAKLGAGENGSSLDSFLLTADDLDTYVTGKITIKGGSGRQGVQLENRGAVPSFGSLNARLGGGNDIYRVDGFVAGVQNVNLGGGRDQFRVDDNSSWDPGSLFNGGGGREDELDFNNSNVSQEILRGFERLV